MSKSIPLVRVAVLRPVIDLLLKVDADVRALLREADMPVGILAREESLMPLHQAIRFIELAARREGMEYLGLSAGLRASIESLGTFGRILRGAATLEEGLARLFAVNAAFNSGERWWLVPDGDRVRLCHHLVEPIDRAYRQADQYTLGMIITLVRLAGGRAWTPDEIQLQAPGSGDHLAYGPLERVPVRFDQKAMVLTFPSALLARRLRPAPDATPDRAEVDHWFASAPAKDFVRSVQQVIASLMPTSGQLRIGTVANALCMSVRTLQRQFAEHGLCFEGLARTDRLRCAADLLARTDCRVLDIALDLGYSDHAHFTRAFRRWTGVAPLAYRRACRNRVAEHIQETTIDVEPVLALGATP
ncbi:MAG TPA: AraC family transcriptional regulator ligand-binding domain-containing protein [Candidatus Eisenbacteria bacterium]|nr:AraC family transcriptional regulator ligand-binding domain-containing protein [Candidatus Eisenbacteria bacterium]